MRRSWLLAAGLALVLLGALALRWRGRASAPPPRTRARAVESPALELPGLSTPSAAAPRKAAAPSPMGEVLDSQRSALRELLGVLDAKGARQALRFIREAALGKPASPEAALRLAYLTRLIPFVAESDGAATPEALALSLELLTAAPDPWVRAQAAAGLGGLSSANVVPVKGARTTYVFFIKPPDPIREGPFFASLREAARRDASAGGALSGSFAGEKDPLARSARALALGELAPPGGVDTLRSALLSDGDARVRRAALAAMESAGAPDLAELARGAVRRDEDAGLREDALGALARKFAAEPATAEFFADCLARREPSDALPALVRGSLASLEAAPSPALRDGLGRLLLEKGSDPDVADAFAREAVERGQPAFLPLLRTMEASLPAVRLEDAPRYAAIAKRVKDVEAAARALREEAARSSTSDARREDIQSRLNALFSELLAGEEALGR
jgi:hypothetical protein